MPDRSGAIARGAKPDDAHAVRDLTETTLAECTEEYGVAPTLILHDTLACSMSKDENLA
jgi:hypothetical protein